MKKLFAFKSHYQKIKEFYNRFERWLMPVTLAAGFLVDYVTFVSIEVNTALIILAVYWIVCASAILFLHTFDAGNIPEKFKYFRLFVPLLIQFTFGGLLSNSFIFYWFSGSIWVSWPFILAFVFLMVFNDALRHRFLEPAPQLSVFYFATFSVISVSLPFKFNSLDTGLFVVSGLISLLVITVFILILDRISWQIKTKRLKLAAAIGCIFAAINIFYFADLIPPVPLAVRETGLYHNVQRSGNQYILKGEPRNFWQKLITSQTLHLASGERAYVYTAIFAPKLLNTPIIHEWQYYDRAKNQWVVKDRLSFNLAGGRKEGFRGYSLKTVLPEGKWRVYVKTQRGQTLTRIKFNIIRTNIQAPLVETVR